MRNVNHRARRKAYCGTTEKFKYLEAGEARANMGYLVAAGESGLNVFRCKDCGEWHIGHMNRSIRQRFGFEPKNQAIAAD